MASNPTGNNVKQFELRQELDFNSHFCSVSSESENFTNGDFHVYASSRRVFSSLLDVKRTLLLVPINETLIGSLLTLGSRAVPVSTDEIRQSICSSNDTGKSQIKRSVTKLQDSGMMPKRGKALVKCPSSVDQACLALKDDDPPSE